MSTATSPEKPNRYVNFDEFMNFQLEKTRKSIKSNDLLTASAIAVTLLLVTLFLFVLLDHWVIPGGFSVAARWCWFLGCFGLFVGWLVWKIGIPALSNVNRLFAAKELEQADPKLRGNLLNWVDLQAAGRPVHPVIMQTIEKQAATELSKMDVGQAVDHRALLSASYALLAIVVLFCGYALLSPKKITTALWRVLPFTESGAVTRTVIQEVSPGDATLLARGRLDLSVLVGGEVPSEIQMRYSTADGRVQDETVVLRPETEGFSRFRGSFAGEGGQGVLQNFNYFIEAGDARSQRYYVTVHHPPSATVQQVTVKSPDYTNLEEAVTLGGHIEGWEEAIATISAASDKPCRTAILQFIDDPQSGSTGEEVPVQVDNGTQLTATWKLAFRSDGSFPKHYRIQCRNDAGEVDPSPAIYNISIKRDLPPDVVLLYPERDFEAPANAVIPLLVQASDPDFELGYVNLLIEKDGQTIHRSQLSEGRQKAITVKYNLHIEGLALKPGDEAQLWVEAFDNKQPRRNRKNTPKLNLRIIDEVKKEEAQQQLAEAEKERDQQLAEAQQNDDSPRDNEPKDQDTEQPKPSEPLDPKDRETKPQDKSDDEKQQADGQEGTGSSATSDGNSKSQSANSTPNNKQGKNAEQNSESGNDDKDSGKSENENSSLSDSGEDDAEALQRLNDRLNQKRKDNPDESSEQQSEKPEQRAANTQQKPGNNQDASSEENNASESKPNEPSDDSDSNGQPETKPGTTENGKKESGKGQNEKLPNSKSSENTTGSEPMTEDETSQEEQTQSDPAAEKKGSKSKSETKSKQTLPNPSEDQPKQERNQEKKSTSEAVEANKDQPESPPNEAESATEKTPSELKDETKTSANEKQKSSEKPNQSPQSKPDSSATGSENAESENAESEESANESSSSGNESSNNASEKGGTKNSKSKSKGQSKSQASKQNAQPSDANSAENSSSPSNDSENASSENDSTSDSSTKKNSNESENKNSGKGKPSSSPEDKSSSNTKNKTPQAQPDDLENAENAPDNEPLNPKDRQTSDDNTETADEELKGAGKPNEQKSEQPNGGKKGNSKRDKEGKSESETEGPGEPTDQPGDETESEEPTGKPDPQQRPGNGSKTKPVDQPGEGEEQADSDGTETTEKSANKSAKQKADKAIDNAAEAESTDENGQKSSSSDSSQGKESESSSGGSESEESSSQKSGTSQKPKSAKPNSSSSKPGQPGETSESGKGGATGNGFSGNGNQADDVQTDPEAANLEYNRQAAELVLQRLQDDLNNHQVDPKLLDDLGWTPDQLQKFVDRLARQLERPAGELSPVEEARRRQFEEMLKSLDLKHAGSQNSGKDAPQREIDQTGARRAPVPSEYKASWEALTKSLSRSKPATKKTPSKTSK